MRNTRKGVALGMGKGYKNVLSIYDPHVHSMSARGIKTYTTLNMYGIDEIKRMNQEQARKSRGKQPYVASASTDFDAIRQIPNFGDYRPKGWKLGEVYFVDSSGMGQEGESALTINQFLKEVKAGKGYAIIEAGQFQVKIGEFTRDYSLDAKGKVQYKIMMNHIGNYSDHPPFNTKEEAEAYLKKSQEMYKRFYGEGKNKYGEDYKSAYSVVPVTLNAKIKGWQKNTKSSWRNKNNSDIISYEKNTSYSIPYRIMVGKSIAEKKEIDSTGSLDRAKKIIYHYMKTHPSDLNAKGKKDWVDKLYGHKTSKKTKLVTKGVVYTAGALALLGASSRVLRAKGGKR